MLSLLYPDVGYICVIIISFFLNFVTKTIDLCNLIHTCSYYYTVNSDYSYQRYKQNDRRIQQSPHYTCHFRLFSLFCNFCHIVIFKQCLKFLTVDSLFLNQKSCTLMKHFHILFQNSFCTTVTFIYYFLHFLINCQ